MRPLMDIKDVTFAYPDQPPVFEGLSAQIDPGEFILVTGSSGAGKSTFLRLLNGLVPNFSGGIFSGRVEVAGFDTLNTPTRELARSVSFVFQDPESQFIMSDVASELAFALENQKMEPDLIRLRIIEAAKTVGINDLMDRAVRTLSAGQMQRVALAQALATRPLAIVLDEPTSQLDPQAAEKLFDSLESINDAGCAIIVSEHRLERVLSRADRVFDMDLMSWGTPKEMAKRLKHPPQYTQFGRMVGMDPLPLTVDEARKSFSGIELMPCQATSQPKKNETIIRFEGVSKCLGSSKALDKIDLCIRRQEFISIVGGNGAGKTTLVSHFNGINVPDEGEVISFGVNTASCVPEDLAPMIGYVSQDPSSYLFHDTLRQELEFTLKCQGVQGDIDGTLECLGLSDLSGRYPRDLSGGERQLAAIASVLVADPDILVLDEPTRGVDPQAKLRLIGILKRLRNEGKTIVVVTHDIDMMAYAADRVIVMDSGKITADGAAKNILSSGPGPICSMAQVFSGQQVLSASQAYERMPRHGGNR